MITAMAGQRAIAPIGENDFMSTDALGELQPGENMVWSGTPVRHRILRAPDILLIPFSLVWGGFAVFWEAGAIMHFSDAGLPLVGVPFVLGGLFLIFGRFVVRSIASRRARYLVTDRRVVVTGGVTGRAVGWAYLAYLPPPVVKERADGSGDLAFGTFSPGVAGIFLGRNRFWFGYEPLMPLRLRDIPDVTYVCDLIAARQTAARQGMTPQ
jgi:hypothetical protein